RQVVVVLADGLGWWQLERFCASGATPFLKRIVERAERGDHAQLFEATTVFPSTTAAAITTMHTAHAAGAREHRLLRLARRVQAGGRDAAVGAGHHATRLVLRRSEDRSPAVHPRAVDPRPAARARRGALRRRAGDVPQRGDDADARARSG